MIKEVKLALNLFFAKYKKPRPYVVHINQNNFCNLHCDYCYGNYWSPKTKDLSTITMKRFIDDIVKLGTKRIMFCAAEPLMRKDIGELIRYAQDKGLLVGMNTNGHLVRKRIEDIKTLNSITISLDGIKKHHDIGKGKGSYDIVIDAIKYAKEHGISVHTSTMIGKRNIDDINHILEVSEKMGFMTEWLLPFYNGSAEWIPEEKKLKKALVFLYECKKNGYRITSSKKTIMNAIDWVDYQGRRHIKSGEVNWTNIPDCSAGKYGFIMENDGKIYPCGQQITVYPGMDHKKNGLAKCYEFVKDNNCRACYSFFAMKDYTLLINHDWSVWWNYLKNYFMERRMKNGRTTLNS